MKSFRISTADNSLTLADMCIARIGALLRDHYYYQQDGTDSGYTNPFVYIPPVIANELFQAVKIAETTHTSRLDVFFPLLTSGRLTDLDLSKSKLDHRELIEIFLAAAPHASSLRRLSVGSVPSDSGIHSRFIFTLALVDFVSRCVNLEHVCIDTDIQMLHLRKILELPRLKALDIPFAALKTFATSGMDGPFCYSLTHLSLGSGVPQDLIAKFLMCCPNLVTFDHNISGALEMLHGANYSNGTLNTKYNLQNYILGPASFEAFAPLDVAIHIAAETCPMTSDLFLYPLINNHREFVGLTHFKNIVSLTMDWIGSEPFDFDRGFTDALKCIGDGIKVLDLRYFTVDFEVVGNHCPNLVVLKARHRYSHNVRNCCKALCGARNSSSTSFAKLEELEVQCCSRHPVSIEDLKFLLRNCKNIKCLHLQFADSLTDEAMEKLLRQNSMSNLKKVNISMCSLTEKGIQLIIETCRSLEDIRIFSLVLPEDAIIEHASPHTGRISRIDNIVSLLNSYPVWEKTT